MIIVETCFNRILMDSTGHSVYLLICINIASWTRQQTID